MSGELASSPRRTPATPKGRAMQERLLQAAQRCLLRQGCQGASVSSICKEAGVANGSFYQYFPDRDAVVLALMERFQQLLLGELQRAADQGRGLKGRIEALAATLCELLIREASLLQVFREAEFVATATSRSFYHTLEQELPRLLAAPPQLDPRLLTYFLLGAVYFNAIGRAVWGLQHQPLPTVVELLLHGMAPAAAPPGLWRLPPELPELPEPDLRAAKVEEGFRPISGGELTRQRLLAAAEGLFGLLGYQECTISRITEAAPAGLGTFYLHFASKQELLAELVRGTREHLKRYVARGAARAGHRLSAEVLGLRAFLRFLGRHGAMYRVVREAEFVEQQIGLGYYLDIAEGYRQSLAQGMAAGQVRELDPFSLGLALMGIGHFLGQRWGVEPGAPVPAPVQSAMVELCMRGVLGVAGGEPAPGRPGEGEVP